MATKSFSRSGNPPVPPGTPSELREVGWGVREPVDPSGSDLGVTLTSTRSNVAVPKHRLVVLGDSISHGFKSFAIADTHIAWPALVATYAGITDFRFPLYPGPEGCPGLPLNLEALARRLEVDAPESVLDVAGDSLLVGRLRHVMDEVEDYWERGYGSDLVERSGGGPVNHNLAVWGWDIRDVLSRTVGGLRHTVASAPGRGDGLIKQMPSAAGERSALVTLAGGAASDTAVSLAQRLGADSADGGPGIETLVVALGANNILGTVLDFAVRWSGQDFQDVDRKGQYNAWLPTHFAVEFDALLEQVRAIRARHVIFLTVPHVTIAPMVRGIGAKMPGDRYFARYTRAWIGDDVFSANRHPCLTGEQLRVLDFAVDQYNVHIQQRVLEERFAERDEPAGLTSTRVAHDWRLLDIAGILDRLAYRRFLIDAEAQPAWWTPYPLPDAYRALSPQPDTRFYRSDRFGRFEGGLFALDGIHPTTIGYAIVAREVMRVMADSGVALAHPEPDFEAVIKADRLISEPPARISSFLEFIETANRVVDLYQAIRHGAPV